MKYFATYIKYWDTERKERSVEFTCTNKKHVHSQAIVATQKQDGTSIRIKKVSPAQGNKHDENI